MVSIGQRGQQAGDKDRPHWVYIWQGDLSSGGAFGALGGWVRYDAGYPQRRVNFANEDSFIECIRNCNPRRGNVPGPPPVYRVVNRTAQNPIPDNDGRPPSVTAFVPEGLPGETGAIPAFFPPISVDVDCQQTPLRIEGGQIETIYDLTLTAEGFIREETTNRLLAPFNVSTVARGPGPIIGYTVSQYTFGTGQKDLRAVVYYQVDDTLADFRKNFRLSLSALLGDSPNMTLEGNIYYFDIETVTLDNLVRADGLDDSCGTSFCDVTYELNYYETGNPTNIITEEVTASGLSFVVYKLTLTGSPGDVSRQVLASNIDDTVVQPIRQALSNEVIVSAPILNIDCTYDVNGQLPGCFVETPETCQVTISDRSGVLFQQTYFGRPEIETSTELVLPEE